MDSWVNCSLELNLRTRPEHLRRFRANKRVQVNSGVESGEDTAFATIHADAQLREGHLRPSHCGKPSVVHAAVAKGPPRCRRQHVSGSEVLRDGHRVHVTNEQQRHTTDAEGPDDSPHALIRWKGYVKKTDAGMQFGGVPPLRRHGLGTQQ